MITHYKIVRSPNYELLEERVSAAMKDGWQPFSAISVAASHQGPTRLLEYIQTMVKHDASDKEE